MALSERSRGRRGLAEVTIRLGTSATFAVTSRARTKSAASGRARPRRRLRSLRRPFDSAVSEAEWRLGNDARHGTDRGGRGPRRGSSGSWRRTRMIRRLADWALNNDDIGEARTSHRGVAGPVPRARDRDLGRASRSRVGEIVPGGAATTAEHALGAVGPRTAPARSALVRRARHVAEPRAGVRVRGRGGGGSRGCRWTRPVADAALDPLMQGAALGWQEAVALASTLSIEMRADLPSRHGDLPLHRCRGLDASAPRARAPRPTRRRSPSTADRPGGVRRQSGVEVDTQGDAFFFAFPTAPGAIAAASAFTEALSAGPIRSASASTRELRS